MARGSVVKKKGGYGKKMTRPPHRSPRAMKLRGARKAKPPVAGLNLGAAPSGGLPGMG